MGHDHAPKRLDGAQSAGAARRTPNAHAMLRLQRGAGNRATGRMLQRFDIWDVVKGPIPLDVLIGPVGRIGLNAVWDRVVSSNRETAKPIPIPSSFPLTASAYATHAPEDGKILQEAIARKPRFWVGGWLIDKQDEAEAITLDRDVFVSPSMLEKPDGPRSDSIPTVRLSTYMHELVHVKQYGDVGWLRFLSNYYGEVAEAEILSRLQGGDIDPFRASTYEKEGYELEERFKGWQAAFAEFTRGR
jgi:hypothetical protein